MDWTAHGQPRSRLYGDLYFSADDGLAESRAVYLQGCGLPAAWASRARFTVAELGFGTGLNIAALLDLWRREGPAAGRLHIFSVEAHPLSAAEAARALALWPELAAVAGPLIAGWPGRARGLHRVELPKFRAILDVAVLEAAEALAGWDGKADAWFLDGFSPSLNPAMWRDEVLGLVAARSASGARAASFTVAGQVRRGLAAAGFAVEKRPGHGRKRERLEARLAGEPGRETARRVAIVGAGVAGAAAAQAVRALGGEALLIEAERPGAGGSGNPAALVTPRLDAGLGLPARLFAQAFARAVALYEQTSGSILSRGVLQLAGEARDAQRFAKIAASDLFEPEALAMLAQAAATERLGEAAPAALAQETALVVEPARVLAAWGGDVQQGRVAVIVRDGAAWSLRDADGAEVARAEAVIVAAGLGSRALVADLPLQAVRGQASWAPGVDWPGPAAAWGGYALPAPEGVLFGATHDRDDEGLEVRDADHARNLATLGAALPALAAQLAGTPLEGRASIRAVTPDRLPLAGAAAAQGLYLLAGFGSRGFSLAPLLAEHVAALALGVASPLPLPLAELVDPGRFLRRRGRPI
ncbi:MAG: tRNA (5-methylaminomethyl-2-thiouridine)(34)-methyltransferase MnmD [Phenylobacterium sp.]